MQSSEIEKWEKGSLKVRKEDTMCRLTKILTFIFRLKLNSLTAKSILIHLTNIFLFQAKNMMGSGAEKAKESAQSAKESAQSAGEKISVIQFFYCSHWCPIQLIPTSWFSNIVIWLPMFNNADNYSFLIFDLVNFGKKSMAIRVLLVLWFQDMSITNQSLLLDFECFWTFYNLNSSIACQMTC